MNIFTQSVLLCLFKYVVAVFWIVNSRNRLQILITFSWSSSHSINRRIEQFLLFIDSIILKNRSVENQWKLNFATTHSFNRMQFALCNLTSTAYNFAFVFFNHIIWTSMPEWNHWCLCYDVVTGTKTASIRLGSFN